MTHKKLTITVEEKIYKDLQKVVGSGKISSLLNELAKNHLKRKAMEKYLDEGYKAMAADKEREKEAREWCGGFDNSLKDIQDDYS